MNEITVQIAEEDQHDAWNSIVNQSPNGTFYHTWEWTKVIEDGIVGNGESTYRICAIVDGKVAGIMPVFIRKAFIDTKLKVHLPLYVAWSPHPKLYGFGGPCTTPEHKDEVSKALISESIKLISEKHKMRTCWMWCYDERPLENVLARSNYQLRRHKKTSFIDLRPPEDDILNNIKKKYRQNIRTAEKSGVRIIESNNVDDVDHFYNKFQTELIKNIKSQPGNKYRQVSNATLTKNYFDALFKHAFSKKMARLFFAEYQGERIGALINFYFKGVVSLGHTSILSEHGNLQAYKLLIWNTILDAKNKGYVRLDLTGLPPDESHGQYRFKKDWNGDIVDIGIYKRKVE